MQRITPIVLNLLIINVLVYLSQAIFSNGASSSSIMDLFALHHYKSQYFKPHQLVTYMFLHGGFFHLFFNMLGLWMFGSTLESYIGPKRFLILYFSCGVLAGLTQMGSYIYDFRGMDHFALDPNFAEQYQELLRRVATVGASGAIMGVMAGFAYLLPNEQLIIIPIPFPIKAKWAIGGMILYDVFGGVTKPQGDHVAHFAHIGGAIFGLVLIFLWYKSNRKTFY